MRETPGKGRHVLIDQFSFLNESLMRTRKAVTLPHTFRSRLRTKRPCVFSKLSVTHLIA
jgi:hypothetical protein